ncbi:recombinase RecT [Bartonella sp. DGB2]|uniref:recombinase RecT n=1 Tax=Bartonella sp. DGB2 TaxID=3388426 RepID=UPI00399033D4
MTQLVQSPLALMASNYGFSEEAFRQTIMKTCMTGNIAAEEFAAFISVANTYGLNPLTKEIYAFPKRGGGITHCVSIDGWIKIIKSNPAFDGMTFKDHFDQAGNLISITCSIRLKSIKDPIEVTEYLKECQQQTDPWRKWPARMLRHKATIQCARYAFGFSGIYDEDEATRLNAPVSESQEVFADAETLAVVQQLILDTETDEAKALASVHASSFESLSQSQAQTLLQLLKKKQALHSSQAQTLSVA